ncbi:MAG: DUF5050 domain-containing protein [Butyrivibrio sp.]|nr:DUF5050 domain-containing protein [Butyrivibrio sp.]
MAKQKQVSKRSLIIIIISIAAVVILGIVGILSEQIKLPPEGAVGNTAGNLNNEGLFFEMDGVVYFSNVSDNGCLYSMNPDETNIKKLTTMHAKYINGYDKYLYFYMDSTQGSVTSGLGATLNQYGLYRSDLDGTDQYSLVRDLTGTAQLVGPYLYYQIQAINNKGTLNKIRIDRQDDQLVLNEMVSPACVYNGTIYYTGLVSDHSLHSLNTQNDTTSLIFNGIYFNPVVEYPYLYYQDENYNLCRVSMMTNESEVLTTDRVDYFNLNSSYIYYSVSAAEQPCIKRINLDGSNPIVMVDGIFSTINLTSKYMYCKPYGADNVMYHVPLEGGISAPFRPSVESN